MKRLWLLLPLFLGIPRLLSGQQVSLARVAEETRRLWLRQDASALVAHSPQLVIQLPGADPSAPIGQQQARELLRDFFQRAEEVETLLSDAREVGGGMAFVEFRRRYRVRGTQEVREQLLLLSFREGGNRWNLVELRVGH